jgi:CheY-like chemotaxis protein
VQTRATTILLAEDNPDDVLILRRALKQAQIEYSLQIVPDGVEAVAYLAGRGKYAQRELYPWPCLLLLDLKMPRLDGFGVLQWMNDHGLLSKLPVVILTSSGEEQDLERANGLGVRSYFLKPPTREMVLEIMRSLPRSRIVPPASLEFSSAAPPS